MKKSEQIWMDGKWVNWDDANVHILTHTLHYGVGVFEGIRCYELTQGGSAVFRLREHIQRLRESAHMFLMEMPFSDDQIIEACLELVRRNKLKACYLRPLVYYGSGEMGLAALNDVKVSIACWEWGTYLGDEGVKQGIRAKISSFRRLSQESFLPKSKACGNYINSVLAKREAMLAGYQEAILLDGEGNVAEATGENVFVVKNGSVYTAPEGASILRGITRDTVLSLLREENIPIVEAKFSRDDLYIADEIFMSGTAAEITPVVEVDNRKVGTGKPGPITQKVQKVYHEVVRGQNERHPEWLAKV